MSAFGLVGYLPILTTGLALWFAGVLWGRYRTRGGAFTRFGHTEVLYVTELIGLALIYIGFRYATRPS